MKQKCTIRLIVLFCALLLVTFSCQKEANDGNLSDELVSLGSLQRKMVKSSAEKQIVVDWLDLHGQNTTKTKSKMLEEIMHNLNYGSLSVENRKNGESIIIIPINNSVRSQLTARASYLKLDQKSIFNLIIIQNSRGELRWSSIVSYIPEDGMNKLQVSKNTIQNIINGERVSDDGMYKFLDLKGNLLYQIGYKNGRLISFGKPVREDLAKLSKSKNTAKTAATTASAASSNCSAYFLIETTYYPDGSSNREETYLFTLCEDEDDEDTGSDGGGGGGGSSGGNDEVPADPEQPNDQEITVSGSFETYEDNFEPEDYAMPEETDIPEETDLDENGNPYPPSPYVPRVTYNHTWSYTYNAIGPFYIKAVYMNDATAHPGNLTYPTAAGQVTRDVTLFDQHKQSGIDASGETATLRWAYTVHTRWTNLTTRISKTIQRGRTYSKTIPW